MTDETPVKQQGHGLSAQDGEMADMLEIAFDHTVIYNHGKGQWHLVNPTTGLWLPDRLADVPKMVDAYASKMLDNLWPLMKADDEKAKAAYKTWVKLRDQNRIKSALEALSQRDAYKTDGSIFDREADMLGVKNGVVDLTNLKLLTGKDARGHYVSQACAVAWPDMSLGEAAAAAKPFTDFLLDVMSGDAAVMNYVLALLGYSLLGTTAEEKFWLMVGDGRNGKGTLTKFVNWLVGDYGVFLDPSLYIRNRFGDTDAERAKPALGNLWGKRFAVTSEPVKGQFNDQMLKAHTGRDPITFRRMRSDKMWTFDPTHTLFFLTQQAPSVEDVGPSMRARARVVNFNQSYVGREDKHLKDKLEKIGSPVLVVLAYAANQYLKHGLAENQTVLDWSDAYINENDPLAQFVAERCVAGRGLKAQAALIYDSYVDWCSQNDHDTMTQTMFGRTLGEKYQKQRESTGVFYHGIRLLGATQVAEAIEEPANA